MRRQLNAKSTLSLLVKQHYEEVDDAVLDIYISTRDLQRKLSPQQVITLLKEGNERFVK